MNTLFLGIIGSSGLRPASADSMTHRPVHCLHLPPPTGGYTVGTVSLHVIDRTRPDPWLPRQPYRELMVGIWYPAERVGPTTIASYLRPGAAAYLETLIRSWGLSGDVNLQAVRIHAHHAAPAARCARRPVLLFSPGHGASRALNTTLVQDLASHGYIVITIDHTYETVVDFPGGRIEAARFQAPADPRQSVEFNRATIAARVADVRTVLDRLDVIASGRGRESLPPGLAGSLDLSRIGMFGHSDGGATAVEAMYYDTRIRAGIIIDNYLSYDPLQGKVLPPVAVEGLDRPVLLLSSAQSGISHRTDPSIASFWDHQRAWKRDLRLGRSAHISFADYETLFTQIIAATSPSPAEARRHREELLGSIRPGEAISAARAYIRAFFDLQLSDRPTSLFDRPSPRYPDIAFIR